MDPARTYQCSPAPATPTASAVAHRRRLRRGRSPRRLRRSGGQPASRPTRGTNRIRRADGGHRHPDARRSIPVGGDCALPSGRVNWRGCLPKAIGSVWSSASSPKVSARTSGALSLATVTPRQRRTPTAQAPSERQRPNGPVARMTKCQDRLQRAAEASTSDAGADESDRQLGAHCERLGQLGHATWSFEVRVAVPNGRTRVRRAGGGAERSEALDES